MYLKLLILIPVLILETIIFQEKFDIQKGKKANYTIEIPSSFVAKSPIGANVDLVYVDKNGSSVITTVGTLPSGVRDEQIVEMSNLSDYQVVETIEANGMEGISLIKRGFITVNNVKSYYVYYTSSDRLSTLYYHSINQFKRGKMINLTITCEYSSKGSYMPYIFRIVNSLKHI